MHYDFVPIDSAFGREEMTTSWRELMTMPSLSADGERVTCFARTPAGFHLFTMGLDGGDLSQVTRTRGDWDRYPRWSADSGELFDSRHRPDPGSRRISVGAGISTEVFPDWQ